MPHYPKFDGCFGCAPDHSAHFAGLGVRAVGAGEFELVLSPGHQGAPGRVHGGVLAAALDEAMGIVAWSLGRPCATAHLEVDYLALVPLGGAVHITARCADQDGRKMYLEAEARLEMGSGPVAARASALYVRVRNWTAQLSSNWNTESGQSALS
jgi:acyl-coenzyme A thioesterase PaaI-like protein